MSKYIEHIPSVREKRAARELDAYVKAGPRKEHLETVIKHIKAKGQAEDLSVLNKLFTSYLKYPEREARIRALWKRIKHGQTNKTSHNP